MKQDAKKRLVAELKVVGKMVVGVIAKALQLVLVTITLVAFAALLGMIVEYVFGALLPYPLWKLTALTAFFANIWKEAR